MVGEAPCAQPPQPPGPGPGRARDRLEEVAEEERADSRTWPGKRPAPGGGGEELGADFLGAAAPERRSEITTGRVCVRAS